MEGNTHQKIDNVEGGKEKEDSLEGPLADPIHLEEDGLKKEEQQPDPDHLSGYHHKEMRPVGHRPHEANLEKQAEESEIAVQRSFHSSVFSVSQKRSLFLILES